MSHNTNGTQDGKRCDKNLSGNAGHHIATAGRDFIDGYRQSDAGILYAEQLAGSQAIAMHHPATTLESQEHFVRFRRHGQDGGNLLAQLLYLACLHIAIKVQHEYSWLPALGGITRFGCRLGGFAFSFFLLFLFLATRFQLDGVVCDRPHCILVQLKPLVERVRFNTTLFP